MKLILRIFIIAVLTYLLSPYAPWWVIILIGAIASYLLPSGSLSAFVSGFIGGGVVWLAQAWILDLETKSILSNKVVALFPFEDPLFLIVGAGIIGGIAGGLGAATGNGFRQLFIKKKKTSFYS